ncbi:hypothetical protein BZA77DRAFT_290984 [Pyronema omphalodes]|nr:hypothetical protein BZA77DRAFT_290984 [Pyronema omphalodes]
MSTRTKPTNSRTRPPPSRAPPPIPIPTPTIPTLHLHLRPTLKSLRLLTHTLLLYNFLNNLHTLCTMHYEVYNEEKARDATTVVVVGVLMFLEWYGMLDLGVWFERLEGFVSGDFLGGLMGGFWGRGVEVEEEEYEVGEKVGDYEEEEGEVDDKGDKGRGNEGTQKKGRGNTRYWETVTK